tara:strand:+ start:164998 stop:166221 length:1224 start_codon:yes stop_codon:yes gene_type:complete
MYAYVTALLIFSVSASFANENCKITNINNFYNYVRDNGPTLREVEKQKEQVSSEIDLAEQRPNPQVDFDYLKGDQFGIDVNNYTLSAQHIIEFGSKRDKRISKAKAFKTLNESKLDLSLYNSNSNSALIYQKVAQLAILTESVKEASNTFDKVIKKLASRKRLNPEETVSLSTLRLASNDYKAQLNDLENQKNLLEGKLEFFTKCEGLKPKYHNFKFPESDSATDSNEQSGLVKLEDFKVDLASEELEVQKSLGYSNIQIGPMVEYQTQGNDEFVSAGVSISFALPLFHTNDGGKLKALNGLRTQKVQSSNAKNMLLIERKNLVKKYNRSLRTYQNMPTLKELEKKHTQVESLFARGVVSIPMTIESHRQQVDFLRSRFETENDLLSTYIKINLIDGDLKGFDNLIR